MLSPYRKDAVVRISASSTHYSAQVVAKSSDSLVVRTDDHGHRIVFDVDRSTALPDGLAVGRHVRVLYRANGSTGQTAERVSFLEAGARR